MSSTKQDRRKLRKEAEARRELEYKAFYDSQPKGCDNPIKLYDIPYKNFMESDYE